MGKRQTFSLSRFREPQVCPATVATDWKSLSYPLLLTQNCQGKHRIRHRSTTVDAFTLACAAQHTSLPRHPTYLFPPDSEPRTRSRVGDRDSIGPATVPDLDACQNYRLVNASAVQRSPRCSHYPLKSSSRNNTLTAGRPRDGI